MKWNSEPRTKLLATEDGIKQKLGVRWLYRTSTHQIYGKVDDFPEENTTAYGINAPLRLFESVEKAKLYIEEAVDNEV